MGRPRKKTSPNGAAPCVTSPIVSNSLISNAFKSTCWTNGRAASGRRSNTFWSVTGENAVSGISSPPISFTSPSPAHLTVVITPSLVLENSRTLSRFVKTNGDFKAYVPSLKVILTPPSGIAPAFSNVLTCCWARWMVANGMSAPPGFSSEPRFDT